MPRYDLYVLCHHCGKFHDALTRVTLEDAFGVRRVSDVYRKATPLEFHQAIAQIHCSTTNKPVNQENPDMMVLVAVGRWPDSSNPPLSNYLPKK